MIDILAWDWALRMSINPAATRPTGQASELDLGRDFIIRGRVRAPRQHRDKTMRVVLSPFGPKVRFGRGGLQHVGNLKVEPPGSASDFEATLMLPEEGIAVAATALASNWKHLDVWTVDEGSDAAPVERYAFSADIHPNLRAWANGD